MCRKNHLWGLAVICLGLGLLLGCWFQSKPFQICFGLALAVSGICILQKQ